MDVTFDHFDKMVSLMLLFSNRWENNNKRKYYKTRNDRSSNASVMIHGK